MPKVSSDLLHLERHLAKSGVLFSHRHDSNIRPGRRRDLEHGFDLGFLGVGLST
jgi:hypothetical protein